MTPVTANDDNVTMIRWGRERRGRLTMAKPPKCCAQSTYWEKEKRS